MSMSQRDLVEKLEEEREAHYETHQCAARAEQGLQMLIANQLATICMLKNELRAKDRVIERVRSRTL